MPGSIPSRLPRTAAPGVAPAHPGAAQPAPDTLSELLRQHGAVDELPDFSALRVMRKGTGGPWPALKSDTNGFNRFTLLETLGAFYGSGGVSFPDFARLKILRPEPGKPGAYKEIPVNPMTSSNIFDCAKDLYLQFGDILELPEREHTLGESQVHLSKEQANSLNNCLARKVKFVVKGQPTEVTLNGFPGGAYLGSTLKLSAVQQILRSTSDLAHIRVTRTDPQTGKTLKFRIDEAWCEASRPNYEYEALRTNDLWLRDGDVIEVPDKPD